MLFQHHSYEVTLIGRFNLYIYFKFILNNSRKNTISSLLYLFSQSRALRNGTTTASYFATIHLEATLELCNIIGMYMLLYELLTINH